jgi:predicted peptidase
MAEEKKKLTRVEIIERKVSMAQQRDTRVIQISSPGGNTITNILRQFDKVYSVLKARLGEPGERGIPFEEGALLVKEATDIIIDFSNLTEKISGKIKYRYYIPDEIKELTKAQQN